MADNPTKISITGKLAYSDEITISQAAKIIAFLNADESDADGGDLGDSLLDSSKPKKSQSKQVDNPRDAIELSGATKNPEKIVALGAYVLQDGGRTFKTEDVKTQFRRARETPPGNFTRDLNVAIASGWVIEDVDGEYYLNNKFDNIFTHGFKFPKASGAVRVRSVKKPGSKPKSGKPESLAAIDTFDSTLAGYPPYVKMKTGKDRLLWVVQMMHEKHGRNGLTNKEIEFISDTVGVGIPNAHVSAAFTSAKNPGYANRSTQDKTIRITDAGVAYLKTAGEKAEA